MLDQLFDHYKVGIVGFDVVFAERDESSDLGVLRRLGENQLRGNSQYKRRSRRSVRNSNTTACSRRS